MKWAVYREEKGKLNLKQHTYGSASTVTKPRTTSTSDENIRFISALKYSVSSLDTVPHQLYLNSEVHIMKEPFPTYFQLQKSSSSLVTLLHDLGKHVLTDFWFDHHSLAVRASQKSSWFRLSLKRQLLPESCSDKILWFILKSHLRSSESLFSYLFCMPISTEHGCSYRHLQFVEKMQFRHHWFTAGESKFFPKPCIWQPVTYITHFCLLTGRHKVKVNESFIQETAIHH